MLEKKIQRLQEIYEILKKGVSLSESVPLLEEAYKLKQEIEELLKKIKLKITQITDSDEEQKQDDLEDSDLL